MVSAQDAAFELFLEKEPLEDLQDFLEVFNKNLPPDIRAKSIEEVDKSFNIIQHPKIKEYVYLFAFGEKSHPFCASLLATFVEPLDLDQMEQGARLFEGVHSFHNFCTKPSENTILEREIIQCEIRKNELIKANFFPQHSYALHVRGEGFLRNQIRLMMGSLVMLGRGELRLDDIAARLNPAVKDPVTYIAPGSGLILNQMDFGA